MSVNLTSQEAAAPPSHFPYSNWGPWVALLGVVLALGTGIVLGVPALVVGQDSGGIERLAAPSYREAERFDSEDSTALAVDPAAGTLFADHDGSLAAFDGEGEPLPWSPISFAARSAGLAVDPAADRLYVANPDAEAIGVLGPLGGRLRPRASLPVGFAPAALAPAPDGGVYAIDPEGDAVRRLSATGEPRGQLDPSASVAGEFDFGAGPGRSGIAVDESGGPNRGDVYVVAGDGEEEGSIWAFDRDGTLLWELPVEEAAPCGVAVDGRGGLWVGDVDGEIVEYRVPPGGAAPQGDGAPRASASKRACELAFAPDGDLFVAREADGKLTVAGSVFTQLGTVLGFLLVSLAIATRFGAASLSVALGRLGVRGFRLSAIGWMAAAAGAYLLFATVYVLTVVEPKQEDIASSFGPLWVQFLLIVVAASVSEEVCFRGMLFGGLRERLPRVVAALIAAVVFGSLHALTGITAVPPLIAFGFVLCLLYERTGSILPGVILHMLNNSVALLAQ